MAKAPVPKVDYAKGEEKKEAAKLDRETQIALIRTQTAKPEIRDLILKISKVYDLPPLGITILGGKPYVNVTGLDDKVKKRWLNEGWIKSEESKQTQRAESKSKNIAKYEVAIKMFNQQAFTEALMKIANNGTITPEIIQALRTAYTIPFKFDGWASPDTCEGIAYKYEGPYGSKKRTNIIFWENVNMMAERKASNRTKRAATDTGLTSVEEVAGIDSAAIDVEFEAQKEAPKKGKARAKKEPPAKEEVAGKEKVKEEPVAKKEPEEKHEKEDRPVQTSDVPFKKGSYDPKGPPTEWQWKRLDEIEKRAGHDGWREILDDEGIVLESKFTLEKADKIIKNHGTKKAGGDELPLEN